jgi:tetratricopeptide (TPR) repeat protein
MKFKICLYTIFFLMLSVFFCYAPGIPLYAQAWQPSGGAGAAAYTQINTGIELYGDGRWGEAIIQLRRAQQENIGPQARAEAQFWIAMSAFAAGDYKESIQNFDEISRIDPVNVRCADVPYHKGRAYYYLKQYNEAINLLAGYIDSIRIDGRYLNGVRMGGWNEDAYGSPDIDYNRKSAAIYWMGECFYALGDMFRSEELLNIVVKEYPKSHKFEAATNRLALIKQKKIESELLDILKSAPSESVKSSGGSAAQQQVTEEAILEYKKRIAPYLISGAYNEQMNGGTPQQGAPPVSSSPAGAPGLTPASPGGFPATAGAPSAGGGPANKNTDAIMRLLAVKTTALEIMDRLVSALNTYETVEDQRW